MHTFRNFLTQRVEIFLDKASEEQKSNLSTITGEIKEKNYNNEFIRDFPYQVLGEQFPQLVWNFLLHLIGLRFSSANRAYI